MKEKSLAEPKLIDQHGRQMNYLRIAVTDRCNLRCQYCMPSEGIDFLQRKDLLSYEEIIRLSRIFAQLGVNKIRLTGGEPFVRKDIMSLILQLNKIFKSIHITTNATLIHTYFDALKSVGRQRLNISIDSLDPVRFAMMTRRNDFERVWSNIIQAIDLGFAVKLNIVVMKGVNDSEILDFVDLIFRYPISVRFIESMPFNAHSSTEKYFMSADEIHRKIKLKYPELKHFVSDKNSASLHYDLPGAQGNIGIIPAYSRSLCAQCNRIRLTPKGELLTCLYAERGVDLKEKMRKGYQDEELKHLIIDAVSKKKKNGFEEEKMRKDNKGYFQSMTSIGG